MSLVLSEFSANKSERLLKLSRARSTWALQPSECSSLPWLVRSRCFPRFCFSETAPASSLVWQFYDAEVWGLYFLFLQLSETFLASVALPLNLLLRVGNKAWSKQVTLPGAASKEMQGHLLPVQSVHSFPYVSTKPTVCLNKKPLWSMCNFGLHPFGHQKSCSRWMFPPADFSLLYLAQRHISPPMSELNRGNEDNVSQTSGKIRIPLV